MHNTYRKPRKIVVKTKNLFLAIPKNIFGGIPREVRIIALSLFIYVFWRWLGWETFFSLYIDKIVDNVFWISIVSAILSLCKMFLSISAGKESDNTDIRSVILLNKIVYAFVGILYFLAWFTGYLSLLILAVLMNGIASAWMFTSYQSFIRKNTKNWERGKSFGLYYVAINISVMLGALIAAVLIKYIDIHFLYLFIPVFTVLSMLIDKKLPQISKSERKKTFWNQSFIQKYMKNVFSFRPIKKVFSTLQGYSSRMYYALWFEMLFSMLNYIGFIFVPIVAIANNLSLSQIAIVFAVMRFPYIIDLFINNFSARKSKRKVLFLILLFMSLLYLLLGYHESFNNILIITFGISLWLALMRPIISAYVSDCTNPKEEWTISWIAEFVGKAGEIVWVLLFGVLSLLFGVQWSFIVVGVIVFIVSVLGLFQRYKVFWKRKRKRMWFLSAVPSKNIHEPFPMTWATQV